MRFSTLILSLAALVAGLFLLSLITGAANIPPRASLHALLTGEGGPMALVMREIRLPRAILAALVGVSLGLSGAVLQVYLQNPLAEPSAVGVSASAALASVLPSLVLNLSPNPFAANEIVFWMMGSLADRSFTHLGLSAPVMVLGWLLLARTARGLEALTLGEDAAASMGIDLRRLRQLIVFGAATVVAGAIGFVGLIVPHVLRPLLAGRPAQLLPVSALGGAGLVLAADVAARLILPDRDLKLGVLMAPIGANGAGKISLMRAALGLEAGSGCSTLSRLAPKERAALAAWLPQPRSPQRSCRADAPQPAPAGQTPRNRTLRRRVGAGAFGQRFSAGRAAFVCG